MAANSVKESYMSASSTARSSHLQKLSILPKRNIVARSGTSPGIVPYDFYIMLVSRKLYASCFETQFLRLCVGKLALM